MNKWCFIKGMIFVSPPAYTTEKNRAMLEHVLNHLPVVRGPYAPMRTYIIEPLDYRTGSNVEGLRNQVCTFIVTIDGELQGVEFEDGKKMFMKWMCRLSRRIPIDDMLVEISSEYKGKSLILNDCNPFEDILEDDYLINFTLAQRSEKIL